MSMFKDYLLVAVRCALMVLLINMAASLVIDIISQDKQPFIMGAVIIANILYMAFWVLYTIIFVKHYRRKK